MRKILARVQRALHRHDPIECWCELTEADRYPNGAPR